MLELLGETQQQILRLLSQNAQGLSIDQIAESLDITRTAVNQHFASLERKAFVQVTASRETGGRPVRLYCLSEAGRELFPKKYSWFSSLLLGAHRYQTLWPAAAFIITWPHNFPKYANLISSFSRVCWALMWNTKSASSKATAFASSKFIKKLDALKSGLQIV